MEGERETNHASKNHVTGNYAKTMEVERGNQSVCLFIFF